MPETPAFDPDSYYDIRLKEPVKLGPIWYRPNADRIRVDGLTLEQLFESVLDYQEVT